MVIVEFGTEGFVCGDLFFDIGRRLEEDWKKELEMVPVTKIWTGAPPKPTRLSLIPFP